MPVSMPVAAGGHSVPALRLGRVHVLDFDGSTAMTDPVAKATEVLRVQASEKCHVVEDPEGSPSATVDDTPLAKDVTEYFSIDASGTCKLAFIKATGGAAGKVWITEMK